MSSGVLLLFGSVNVWIHSLPNRSLYDYTTQDSLTNRSWYDYTTLQLESHDVGRVVDNRCRSCGGAFTCSKCTSAWISRNRYSRLRVSSTKSSSLAVCQLGVFLPYSVPARGLPPWSCVRTDSGIGAMNFCHASLNGMNNI
jgi:hypothetical protein